MKFILLSPPPLHISISSSPSSPLFPVFHISLHTFSFSFIFMALTLASIYLSPHLYLFPHNYIHPYQFSLLLVFTSLHSLNPYQFTLTINTFSSIYVIYPHMHIDIEHFLSSCLTYVCFFFFFISTPRSLSFISPFLRLASHRHHYFSLSSPLTHIVARFSPPFLQAFNSFPLFRFRNSLSSFLSQRPLCQPPLKISKVARN